MSRSRRVLPEYTEFVKERCRSIFGSQRRLADQSMLTRQTVSKFLNGGAIDWENFHDLCDLLDIEDWANISTSEAAGHTKKTHDKRQQRHYFGAAPDFQVQGHTEEKQRLESYVLDDNCHLVVVTGMARIGKTFLVAEVIRNVADQFDFVIWQRVQSGQEPKQLIAKLINFIDDSSYEDTTLNACVDRLIACFRKHRCLVVLNRMELLMQPGSGLGKFSEGNQGYGELLRRVGEQHHQGCLVAVSREPINDLTVFIGSNPAIRQLPVEGISFEDAYKIFQDHHITETRENLHELIEAYGSHPYFLRLAATYIKQLYQGRVDNFLNDSQAALVINGIRTQLDKIFNRLSKREQEVLSWIAIYQIPCSEETLSQFIKTFSADLKGALLALSRRSLVIAENGHYRIHRYLREYLLSRIQELFFHELETRDLDIFNQFPLLLGKADDYVYQQQQERLLDPIFKRLKQHHESGLYRYLAELLETIRAQFHHRPGYAAANLISLLRMSAAAKLKPGEKPTFKGLDFSDLTIKQADFRGIRLENVCFQGTDLEQSVFYEPFGGILSVAMSQDGQFLAAGDASHKVYVWRIEGSTFKLHRKYSGHTHWVRTVIISPTRQYVTSGSEDNTVRIWKLETGETVKVLRGYDRRIRSLAFSPDESYLATSGDDSTVVLWDTKTWQRAGTYTGSFEERRFREVVFDALGKILIAANQNGQIYFWDVGKDPELRNSHMMDCQETLVRTIAIHPNGQIIASGGDDGIVRLYQFPSGELIYELPGQTNWIRKIIFSSDGELIACSTEDGKVQVWSLENRERLNLFDEHDGRVWEIAFAPDGKTIVSGSDDQQIKLWNLAANRCVTTLKGYTCKLRAVAFSPDGKWLASAGDDQIIRLWNMEADNCWNELPGHIGRVWSLSFYREQSGKLYLISGSDDRTVKCWDLEDRKCVWTSESHTSWVRTVCASPTNCLVLSGGDDKVIRAHQMSKTSSPEVQEYWAFPTLHNDWILSLAVSPNGNFVVSGSDDGTAHVWDINLGKAIHTFKQHRSAIRAVAISPDGQWIATGSKDKTIRLFALDDPEYREHSSSPLVAPEGHDGWVRCLAFHPTEPILASGGYDQKAILWSIVTGQPLQVLRGHDEAVVSVDFNPQGSILATGSEDETIRLWDINTGASIKRIRIPRPYDGLKIRDAHLTPIQKSNLLALGATED